MKGVFRLRVFGGLSVDADCAAVEFVLGQDPLGRFETPVVADQHRGVLGFQNIADTEYTRL